MQYTKYLIIFILYSTNIFSFADNCGKTLNTLVVFNPDKNTASIDKFFPNEEEFCDLAINEANANYEVILLNKNKNYTLKKTLYLNPYTVSEQMNSKKPKEIIKTTISKSPVYRTIQFSFKGKFSQFTRYQILNLKTKQKIGEGTIK